MARTRRIAAGEFKARCLRILDEVARSGDELIVTKRGKAVAKVVPVEEPKPLRGSIIRQRDVVSPIDADWDAER